MLSEGEKDGFALRAMEEKRIKKTHKRPAITTTQCGRMTKHLSSSRMLLAIP